MTSPEDIDPLARFATTLRPAGPRPTRHPAERAPRSVFRAAISLASAVAIVGSIVIVGGCSRSDSTGTTGAGGSSAVQPLEISEAAALLQRARQPGIDDRIRICERIVAEYRDAPEAQEALHLLAQTHQNRNEHEPAYRRY